MMYQRSRLISYRYQGQQTPGVLVSLSAKQRAIFDALVVEALVRNKRVHKCRFYQGLIDAAKPVAPSTWEPPCLVPEFAPLFRQIRRTHRPLPNNSTTISYQVLKSWKRGT